jgi:Cu(I)/Ag(I) efflux system protein CusF
MKSFYLAAAALLIAAPALAQPAPDMKAMPGMTAQAPGQSGMIMADGAGVVTSVDAKAGAVTIHHGPIAKLNWPAMTMAFKASDPSLLQGTKVGQAVKFQLMQMNGAVQLTAITPN